MHCVLEETVEDWREGGTNEVVDDISKQVWMGDGDWNMDEVGVGLGLVRPSI